MKNKGVIAGVLLVIFFVVLFFVNNRPVDNARADNTTSTTTPTTTPTPQPAPASTSTLTSLGIQTVKAGTGDRAVKTGDKIEVNYTGTLKDGTKFDSSLDTGRTPFDFIVGKGVIPGWSQGVIGMKVGEERKLSIPASLGYGPQGAGVIPANSDLYFDITMLKFN